mgnify:CR=1 FL=1
MSELRVASYNIHSCIGIDRKFDPARIAGIIRAFDADIIGLQEVGWHHRGLRNFNQFAYLEDATGMTILEGPTKLHPYAHYGNAILTRAPVETHWTLDLSLPWHIPRGCIMAEIGIGEKTVTVINAHLGLTPWDRHQQSRRIAHELDRIDGEIILMGDFNTRRPHGQSVRLLARRLPYYTTEATYHTRLPRAPFDRIYLSENLRFTDISVPRDQHSGKASDHLPIVADIAWV